MPVYMAVKPSRYGKCASFIMIHILRIQFEPLNWLDGWPLGLATLARCSGDPAEVAASLLG